MKQTLDNKNNDLISAAEGSRISGYNQDYLSSLCRSGKLEGAKIGRNWVVSKSSLAKLLELRGREEKVKAAVGPRAREVVEVVEEQQGNTQDTTKWVIPTIVELQLSALKERLRARATIQQMASLESTVHAVQGKLESLASRAQGEPVVVGEVQADPIPLESKDGISVSGRIWLLRPFMTVMFAVIIFALGFAGYALYPEETTQHFGEPRATQRAVPGAVSSAGIVAVDEVGRVAGVAARAAAVVAGAAAGDRAAAVVFD